MLALNVLGMTCGHCVSAITKAILSVDHVDDVAVDLGRGMVTIGGEPARADIVKAVTTAGYGVRPDAVDSAAAPAAGTKACRCG